MKNRTLFFELIQVAIGEKDSLSKTPTNEEWQCLYDEAIRQSLVGLLLSGVERLYEQDASVKPPLKLFYEWVGSVAQMEQKNKKLNTAAAQLNSVFKNGNLRSCVLKGQGLATLYPEPLRRQPGDIDLWVEGSRENTLSFLKKSFLGFDHVVIHHVDAHIIDGVESEIHFMPIWLHNPIHNGRLQSFFKEHADEEFSHFDQQLGFCYSTAAFNGVYILVHNFHHLLEEGVGMRQVIDYYYVLRHLSDSERKSVLDTVNRIGCGKFAESLMYVLGEVCALDRSLMICEPNVKRGKRLLTEIMQTGNFGQFDNRFDRSVERTAYSRNRRKATRWLQLAKDYPSEVLCIPVWKLWHWCWRKCKGYV